MPETTVLVVGAGPVGLSLALLLDHWGVECTIVDEGKTARGFPKGNGENSRTMEIFRQIGLSDEIRELFPNDRNFDQAYFTRFNAWEIFRAKNPSWAERKQARKDMPVDDQYPEPMLHTNQMYLEAYFREKVKEAKNVTCYFGWEAVEFHQTDARVGVVAKNVSNSGVVSFRAAYLADCGGGHSFIRRGLGIHYEGDVQPAEEAHWAGTMWNIWLRIPEFKEKCSKDRQAWFYRAVNTDPDTWSCLIELDGKDDYMLMVKPKSGRPVDEKEAIRWTRESIGDPNMDVQVVDFASWRAGATLAVQRYKTGRIFQLGDAAHLFTPVGSFGMNTGISDAHNLAWKLAAVTQGWGGAGLLQSYEEERRPIGFRNTGAARKYSSLMYDQDEDMLDHLEENTAEGEQARRRIVDTSYIKYNHFNKAPEIDCTGVQQGARYDGSTVIVKDGTAPEDKFPETYDVYTPTSLPGGRVPHVWMEDGDCRVDGPGASLFDRLHPTGYTLLRVTKDGKAGVSVDGLQKAAESRGLPFALVDINRPGAAELYEKSLVLVRPDHYVCWRGDKLPEDCDAVLAQVCGW